MPCSGWAYIFEGLQAGNEFFVIVAAAACDELDVSRMPSASSCSLLVDLAGGEAAAAAPAEAEPRAREAAGSDGMARKDDPARLRTIFLAQYAGVWRLLRRFGVPVSRLDDAAQEVFWVAARRLASIEPGKERAFLYGVALRVASNQVRRQKAAVPLGDVCELEALSDSKPTPEACLEQRRARELLDRVLDAMSAELRTVFVLFELEGLPVRDIATLEQIPVGTASSRLRRAREEFSAIAKRVRAALATRGGR
jgi:RNA polymerase sigma-70 factor (ECF subfamily)